MKWTHDKCYRTHSMQLENTDQLNWWQISASISFSNMTPSAAALHSELHGWLTLLPKATAWIRNALKLASMAFTWLKLFVSTKTCLNWIFCLTKAHFCMLVLGLAFENMESVENGDHSKTDNQLLLAGKCWWFTWRAKITACLPTLQM